MDSRIISNEKKSLAIWLDKNQQLIDKENQLEEQKNVLKEKYLCKKTTAKQKEQIEKEQKDIEEKLIETTREKKKLLNGLIDLLPDDIEINGEKYPLVLNINTFVNIENYYTSRNEWFAQIQDETASAILNGAYCMVNEGIEIYNSTHKDKKALIDKAILGRKSLASLFKVVFKKVLEAKKEEGLALLE